MDTMRAFIENIPATGAGLVSSKIDLIKNFNSIKHKNSYVRSFVQMADRGLYSFDNRDPGISASLKYHLVAYPAVPLKHQTLPAEIGKNLVRLPVKIDELYVLDFEEIKLP